MDAINKRSHAVSRLVFGCLLLVLVNMLWVASAELTRFIFRDQHLKRPFFTTYIKTSMFGIYLFGFIFYRSWRDQCLNSSPIPYDRMDESEEDETIIDVESTYLSEPEFEPINNLSDMESEHGSAESFPIQKKASVRFKRTKEVRRMPACEADDAIRARLPYEVWSRLRHMAEQYKNRLSIREVARLALTFSFVWFIGNLSYQEALLYTSPSVVNILSSLASLFTLLLAAVLPSVPSDRFTISKLLLVFISIAGVYIVTLVEETDERNDVRGILWALLGSLGYAAYLVLLRRRVKDESKLDIAMFFGFVGLFSTVLLWPILYFLDATGIEPITPLPTRDQLLYVLINGLIGTVLSEYLWLWACFLTSSLVATLSLSVSIPLTMMADSMIWHDTHSWLFYVGTAPIMIAFIGATVLTHLDYDPVERTIASMWRRRHPIALVGQEQSALLIDGAGD